MRVLFSAKQRVGLEALISFQKGTVGQMREWLKLLDKIGLSETEQTTAGILRGGLEGEIMICQRPESVADREVELSESQARMLRTCLETWPGFTTKDLEWVNPILAALGP